MKKTTYVGALSSTDDREPVAQKKCQGRVKPKLGPPMARICKAGCMVMNMPKNSAATSTYRGVVEIIVFAQGLAAQCQRKGHQKQLHYLP